MCHLHTTHPCTLKKTSPPIPFSNYPKKDDSLKLFSKSLYSFLIAFNVHQGHTERYNISIFNVISKNIILVMKHRLFRHKDKFKSWRWRFVLVDLILSSGKDKTLILFFYFFLAHADLNCFPQIFLVTFALLSMLTNRN